MIRLRYWLLSAVLGIGSLFAPCLAAVKPDETVQVGLSSQLEASIHRFGQASNRILWFSTNNTQEFDFSLAKELAAAGLEVWLTPLQAKTKQKQAIKELNAARIAELIQASFPSQVEDKLYIFSTGDTAQAAIDGLKTWQDARGSSPQLGGLVLAYPHLQIAKANDQELKFFEAAYQLKLPIYIFQPEKKLKIASTEALVKAFEQGGSVVYSEVVEDVAEGYLQRPASSEEETLQTSVFPAQLNQALDKLSETKLVQSATATTQEPVLQEHPTKDLAPELRLTDLDGKTQDLKDYRGKVVLLNFWATWCPPCIKEIPSLNNLQKKYSNDQFTVLSVDVGEEPKDIKAFLEHVPADYPVLVDSSRTTTEPWQLKAFPSTYLIDKQGRLRYMYFGGLEWDESEITNFLEKNLEIVAK